MGRYLARREGAAIFDLMQGFIASQVLVALVDLGTLRQLLDRPCRAAELGLSAGIPAARMETLLRAGVAVNLLRQCRDGRFAVTRRGAAILGVPGLEAMILHNRMLYSDLTDPAALLRDPTSSSLSRFWPYVLSGGTGVEGPDAARYSELMAGSLGLVAEDTLRSVPLRNIRHLMDVGGGSGAFLIAALKRAPMLEATLFDLDEVIPAARLNVAHAGLEDCVTFHGGNFRRGRLPVGADAISLIRVLYDHGDDVVSDLLRRVYAALPPGGRLVISEPMAGEIRPDRATDLYFAFYTLAMGTGQVRGSRRIAELCKDAGFQRIHRPRPYRSFVTSVVIAVKQS